jgi:hypothetical protein
LQYQRASGRDEAAMRRRGPAMDRQLALEADFFLT